jgi:hypothetical protein
MYGGTYDFLLHLPLPILDGTLIEVAVVLGLWNALEEA